MTYKDNSQMLEVLHDIRDRVTRIETKMEAFPAVQEEVRDHGKDILKIKTSIKTTKWIATILLVSIPASVAAMVRIFRP